MAKPENTAGEITEPAPRVAFDLTDGFAAEVDKIIRSTDLVSRPDVFRRAFTLLRIHVEAAKLGREVYIVDPKNPNDRYIITLPFHVDK